MLGNSNELVFLSFSFCAAFTHVQSIVEAALPLAFSLLCPCCASLNLPQAALGFAPFHGKEKAAEEKQNLKLTLCSRLNG